MLYAMYRCIRSSGIMYLFDSGVLVVLIEKNTVQVPVS